MSFRAVALDLLAVGAVMSLVSIVLFLMFGAAISLLTVARARRQLLRSASASARGQLPGFLSSKDIAEIDEALERIMSEECRALPGGTPG